MIFFLEQVTLPVNPPSLHVCPMVTAFPTIGSVMDRSIVKIAVMNLKKMDVVSSFR